MTPEPLERRCEPSSVGLMLAPVFQRSRQRLRASWWLWVLIVVVVVALNEVFDRGVAGDKNGHPGGDILVAIVVVVIVLAVWDFVTRKSRPTQPRR